MCGEEAEREQQNIRVVWLTHRCLMARWPHNFGCAWHNISRGVTGFEQTVYMHLPKHCQRPHQEVCGLTSENMALISPPCLLTDSLSDLQQAHLLSTSWWTEPSFHLPLLWVANTNKRVVHNGHPCRLFATAGCLPSPS